MTKSPDKPPADLKTTVASNALGSSQCPDRATLRSRLCRLAGLAIISLVAAALITIFFCPRFVLWRGLLAMGPPAWNNPEVNRAISTLEQIQEPFAPIRNPSNWVIAWRLFFPVIWHYFTLPVWLLLILPQLGCLFTLGLTAHIVYQRTSNRLWTLLATIVIGTTPWFFVSSGWLTYFDSWIMGGLLVLAFSRSRLALVLVCLFIPWIEERLLLGAPLCLVIRALDMGWEDRRQTKELLRDGLAILIPSVVYVVLRIVLAATVLPGGETESYAITYFNWTRIAEVSPFRYLHGVWAGVRAGWFFVAILFWLLWVRDQRKLAGILALVLLGTVALGLVVAADLSRNICLVLPLALMGIVELARRRPDILRIALPVTVVANLLLPASHVITPFTLPIAGLYAEIESWHHLPPSVDPNYYTQQGVQLLNSQKFAEANYFLNNALRLDKDFEPAYRYRAAARFRLGDLNGANLDAEQAVKLDPRNPDSYFNRGMIRKFRQDRHGAVSDLETAIRIAPAEWPNKQEAQKRLNELNAATTDEAPKPGS